VRDSRAPRYYTEAVEICESQAQIEAQVCVQLPIVTSWGAKKIKLGESIDWSTDTYRI